MYCAALGMEIVQRPVDCPDSRQAEKHKNTQTVAFNKSNVFRFLLQKANMEIKRVAGIHDSCVIK